MAFFRFESIRSIGSKTLESFNFLKFAFCLKKKMMNVEFINFAIHHFLFFSKNENFKNSDKHTLRALISSY
jgi:hypothetical protein